MSHALTIDDNMAVGRAIRNRLVAFGFDSFDHTWTGRQALEAAARRRPDLIVVGDQLANGEPLEAVRELAWASDAPMLAVTADRFLFQRPVPAGATADGPYLVGQLDAALAAARTQA